MGRAFGYWFAAYADDADDAVALLHGGKVGIGPTRWAELKGAEDECIHLENNTAPHNPTTHVVEYASTQCVFATILRDDFTGVGLAQEECKQQTRCVGVIAWFNHKIATIGVGGTELRSFTETWHWSHGTLKDGNGNDINDRLKWITVKVSYSNEELEAIIAEKHQKKHQMQQREELEAIIAEEMQQQMKRQMKSR